MILTLCRAFERERDALPYKACANTNHPTLTLCRAFERERDALPYKIGANNYRRVT